MYRCGHYGLNAPPRFAETVWLCLCTDRQSQRWKHVLSPCRNGKGKKIVIMQHCSHSIVHCYIISCYYIMSSISKANNVIIYYIMRNYAFRILLHCESIITFWTFITFELLLYEPLLHYELLQDHVSTHFDAKTCLWTFGIKSCNFAVFGSEKSVWRAETLVLAVCCHLLCSAK